jgi:hypothetical protein
MNATTKGLERCGQTMSIAVRFPAVLLSAVLLSLVQHPASSAQDVEPLKFFRNYVGLHEDQIAEIRNGRAVAKILDSPTPDEVYVFGSVYVKSTPDKYLKLVSDIDELRKLPNYLALQKFSDPPQLSDLSGFTLDPEDIKELQHCKPGHCEVQLPTNGMEAFQQSVNWSAPDVADQVNHLAQKLALQSLLRYQQGGNSALGTYRDKSHPAAVAQTFQSLLNRLKALPVYLPDLDHYLLAYPSVAPQDITSQFYWEKVNFGLKPTFRIVQAAVFRGMSPAGPAYAVAIKQLYASHYFETALDLTICLKGADNANDDGFYLITVKGSQQAGLTGLKGGIVRKVAVDKTRSSLQQALDSIKQKLEEQAG